MIRAAERSDLRDRHGSARTSSRPAGFAVRRCRVRPGRSGRRPGGSSSSCRPVRPDAGDGRAARLRARLGRAVPRLVAARVRRRPPRLRRRPRARRRARRRRDVLSPRSALDVRQRRRRSALPEGLSRAPSGWSSGRRSAGALAEGRDEMDLGGVDVPGARRRPEPGEPAYGMLTFKESFGARWIELTRRPRAGPQPGPLRARPGHPRLATARPSRRLSYSEKRSSFHGSASLL